MSYSNDIIGWMSPLELQWLYSTAKEMDTIVEIGCWKGRSTHALLSGCSGTVHAVDHFKGNLDPGSVSVAEEAARVDIYAELMRNVGHFPNLVVHQMTSLEAVSLFADKSIDMVFIDGEHLYEHVKADILAWLPKTKKIICGHDYCWLAVGLVVNEIFGIPVTLYESIWIKKLQ